MEIGIASIAYLVLLPVLVALVLLIVRNDKIRSYVTVIGALLIACGSIFLAVQFLAADAHMYWVDAQSFTLINYATLVIDAALCLYVIAKGIYYKKYLAVLLAVVQLGLAFYLDLAVAEHISVESALYIDNLSIIMALIIGIIGSGITVYALGYMRVHEQHSKGPDRRHVFFAVMFVFLGAMFALVFCNALTWMLCAWEITTVCSFALIGYTRTEEAIKNSFLQIVLNLIGGIAFSIALIWVGSFYSCMEFNKFIEMTLAFMQGGLVVVGYVPLMLLALAAFTKAAQMPFQSWLLGAMVAPTPTSALLHSSTMVKAGVFLLVKLSPCLGFNIPGYLVMTVGGVTFLFCALAAISQSNAKRVLAYSTISNLGLITACAGVGTEGAVWAAIFLIIFHAAAKSLLFLCGGTAEHHIGSRDIESMDDLFERMPRLARLMAIGIMGMFIAPFGMLVSKWAALQAFASSDNVILIMLLVFGSAATFLFWAKWLGKILAIANSGAEDVEVSVFRSEWSALGLMTVLTVGCCIAFPLISLVVVVPYLSGVFGSVSETISNGDLWIMALIGLVVAVVFLGFTGATKKRVMPVYLSGVGIDARARSFRNSFNGETVATQRNWYMGDLFGEKKMGLIGACVSLSIIFCSFAFVTQDAAANTSVLTGITAEQTSYRNSVWAENGISFDSYQFFYEQYSGSYEQYADEYAKSYGINSVDELMDKVYSDFLNDYESNKETYSGTYGINSFNEYIEKLVDMYSSQSASSSGSPSGSASTSTSSSEGGM